ncbi:hypothetical protein D3C77_268590 [compost metagenome]
MAFCGDAFSQTQCQVTRGFAVFHLLEADGQRCFQGAVRLGSLLLCLCQLLTQWHAAAQPQRKIKLPATDLVTSQPGARGVRAGRSDDARLLAHRIDLDPVDMVIQVYPELIIVQEQAMQRTAWHRAIQL